MILSKSKSRVNLFSLMKANKRFHLDSVKGKIVDKRKKPTTFMAFLTTANHSQRYQETSSITEPLYLQFPKRILFEKLIKFSERAAIAKVWWKEKEKKEESKFSTKTDNANLEGKNPKKETQTLDSVLEVEKTETVTYKELLYCSSIISKRIQKEGRGLFANKSKKSNRNEDNSKMNSSSNSSNENININININLWKRKMDNNDNNNNNNDNDKWKDNANTHDHKDHGDNCPVDRLAVMAPRDFHYPAFLLGAWTANYSVVPLYENHPLQETKYYLQNSEARAVLCHPIYFSLLSPLCKELQIPIVSIDINILGIKKYIQNVLITDKRMLIFQLEESSSDLSERERRKGNLSEDIRKKDKSKDEYENTSNQYEYERKSNEYKYEKYENENDEMLLLFTSGTTSRPKGLQHSWRNIQAILDNITTSWEYSCHDRLLHVLPLYHLHGLCNKLLATLVSGGCVEMMNSPPLPEEILYRIQINSLSTAANEDENKEQQNKSKSTIITNHDHLTILPPITHFHAVPTIYSKLIHSFESLKNNNSNRVKNNNNNDSENNNNITNNYATNNSNNNNHKCNFRKHLNIELLQTELKKMRLFVSGSASLSSSVYTRFKDMTSHDILERYGCTEAGMILTNPYRSSFSSSASSGYSKAESKAETKTKRIKGFVGLPFPSVVIKLVDVDNNKHYTVFNQYGISKGESPNQPIEPEEHEEDEEQEEQEQEQEHEQAQQINNSNGRNSGDDSETVNNNNNNKDNNNQSNIINKIHNTNNTNDKKFCFEGEIYVKGPSLSSQMYYKRPDANENSHDKEGWYMTGDIGRYNPKERSIQIVGRSNLDIIKYKGYKIGSLEIESILLDFPNVLEAVVIGKPAEEVGEIIVALLVLKERDIMMIEKVKLYLSETLPSYKIPKQFLILREIPRNAMGKVNKKTILKEIAKLNEN